MALRDEFPVLEHTAYLNSGTDGPIPRAAAEQARDGDRRRGGRGAAVAALRTPHGR